MKYLRQYIRRILLEDAFDFAKEAGQLQSTGELDMPNNVGNATSKGSRRKVKDLFRKHADHGWLASNITTVHWVRDDVVLEDLVGKGKDEISTSMSKAGTPVTWHDYGAFGLWVKGHITLAANSMNDIVSGHFRDYGPTDAPPEDQWMNPDKVSPEKFKQQQSSSGINKQPKSVDKFRQYSSMDDNKKNREIFNKKYLSKFPYILDADTWEEPGRFPNEALVDNWRATGIIIADPDKVERLEDTSGYFYRKITGIASKFGVPLYDVNFDLLWRPKK